MSPSKGLTGFQTIQANLFSYLIYLSFDFHLLYLPFWQPSLTLYFFIYSCVVSCITLNLHHTIPYCVKYDIRAYVNAHNKKTNVHFISSPSGWPISHSRFIVLCCINQGFLCCLWTLSTGFGWTIVGLGKGPGRPPVKENPPKGGWVLLHRGQRRSFPVSLHGHGHAGRLCVRQL